MGSLGQSYPSGYSDPVNPSAAYGLGDIPWGYPGDKIEVLSREALMQEVGYHPPDPEPPQNAPDPVLAQPLPPGLPIVTSSGEIEASPALTAILSDDYGVHIIDGLIYHYDAESGKWHQYTESEFREKYRAWDPDGTQRTDATQAGTSLVGRVRGAVAGLGQQVGSAINTIKGSLGIGNIRAVPKSKIGQAAYVASEWYKGVALQGPANIANGVQDGVVGLINFPGAIANTVASSVDYVFGADSVDPLRIPYLSSSDWAYGKFTPESQGLHDVSKIAGGFGAELLAGGWLSKVSQAIRGAASIPKGGFGAKGLYTAPTGMADAAVKAAYLEEVGSLAFRVKLGLHNLLTPFHKKTTIGAVREAVESGAFGRGSFTVKMLDDGNILFGGNPTRTFLNRQFFHHELIHVSQMVKNPKLWTEFPLRMLHEPIQIWTAHGTLGWPATILAGWWILESTDGD